MTSVEQVLCGSLWYKIFELSREMMEEILRLLLVEFKRIHIHTGNGWNRHLPQRDRQTSVSLFHFCHSNHTKTNIPYSVSPKPCTIIEKCDQRLNELEISLLKHKYLKSLPYNAVNKAKSTK